MPRRSLAPLLLTLCAALASAAHAAPMLIAHGVLGGSGADRSGLTQTLENGASAALLGGMGSALAWAGGQTFLALPDRGPNADSWNAAVDNTTSYVARFHTLQLGLKANAPGSALPFALTPTLTGTTLLHSPTPLHYGSAPTALLPNAPGRDYFTGRSDAFDPAKGSMSPDHARLDPEGLRVSRDGRSVYISDEYGPYVYRFDRATGARTATYTLPAMFGVDTLSAQGSQEITGNASGRVANKGMEGLAISPDGRQLVGFMQSALLQDGGDGARANRIVTIDTVTGQVRQYAYDNQINGKNYGSSEILALNDHQFLVLERDGKGLGDGSKASVKRIYLVDLKGAQDVSGLSGEAALLAKAPSKKLFLDIRSALNAAGFADPRIPAKLEGLAFGEDVQVNGQWMHTLYVANDNDFQNTVGGLPNPNQWFVFGVTDQDLKALGASYQPQQFDPQRVPEPATLALLAMALAAMGVTAVGRRRR